MKVSKNEIVLTRQSGMAKNGWVRNEGTQQFVVGKLVNRTQSGNETWRYTLQPGKYTAQEIYYGAKTREEIEVKS